MYPEILMPSLFSGMGVTAFFTTKAFPARPYPPLPDLKEVFLPVQRHTDSVYILSEQRPAGRPIADAVITDQSGVSIGVQVADCVPVLILDPVRRLVAAVHAGWRGTSAGILAGTIGLMEKEFISNPSDCLVAIGPSIRACCYEVGDEVVRSVSEETGPGNYVVERKGAAYLDLPEANRLQAKRAGVRPDRIADTGECTCCSAERYFSYRRTGGKTGRQYGIICLIAP